MRPPEEEKDSSQYVQPGSKKKAVSDRQIYRTSLNPRELDQYLRIKRAKEQNRAKKEKDANR
jgi:hypothetical protein